MKMHFESCSERGDGGGERVDTMVHRKRVNRVNGRGGRGVVSDDGNEGDFAARQAGGLVYGCQSYPSRKYTTAK